MPRSKWNKNLENENVKRWYDTMRKQSRARAGVYFRLLSRFCENYAKMSPWEFARLPKRKMEEPFRSRLRASKRETKVE